ncbi:MAG: 3-dehydroquinate synthase [Planctomycetota bacterium]
MSTNSTELTVALGDRSYPIQVVTSESQRFAPVAGECLGDWSHAILIADEAVSNGYAQRIHDVVMDSGVRITRVNVASGETSKATESLDQLWNAMAEDRSDRRSVVLAIGGGVIGDLAGFAAASFMRGLRLIQIPTTLLAMVDSSVGGKTGINLPAGKNLVGAFWQPSLVWIDTQALETLPDREYLSGLAEVIKYGVIEDAAFFGKLESETGEIKARDPKCLRDAIFRSCQSKARVVADDEQELTGRRAILNYGHTFAHAIEANAGYGKMLHGEAVAIGMQMAARLAIHLELCDGDLLERQTRLLQNAGLPISWAEAEPERMLPVMARDKKVSHGKLRFVLPRKIGQVEIVGDVAPEAVAQAIEATR